MLKLERKVFCEASRLAEGDDELAMDCQGVKDGRCWFRGEPVAR